MISKIFFVLNAKEEREILELFLQIFLVVPKREHQASVLKSLTVNIRSFLWLVWECNRHD